MSLTRNQFIEENRDVLQSYLSKVTDEVNHVIGFGCRTPLESFKAILEDGDNSRLPLCFLYVLWDFKDPESQKFVLDSLESLYWIDDNGKIMDPVIAYVYAYCLFLNEKDNQSNDVLKILEGECFPPALATMGDGCVAHSEIAAALDWYKHAVDHGHLMSKGIYNKLILKNLPFPKNLPFLIYAYFIGIPNGIKIVSGKVNIENSLYLDFYGLSYYLNEYWNTPKANRIRSLRDQSVILRKTSNG